MRTLLSLLVVVLVLGLGSCKKDKDPVNCSAAWANEVQDELTAVIDALEAYSTDPSATTCNAYKDAYLDYIDAIEPFLECSAITANDRELIEAAISQAESEMEALNCDI